VQTSITLSGTARKTIGQAYLAAVAYQESYPDPEFTSGDSMDQGFEMQLYGDPTLLYDPTTP